jgi:hypothetical protein
MAADLPTDGGPMTGRNQLNWKGFYAYLKQDETFKPCPVSFTNPGEHLSSDDEDEYFDEDIKPRPTSKRWKEKLLVSVRHAADYRDAFYVVWVRDKFDRDFLAKFLADDDEDNVPATPRFSLDDLPTGTARSDALRAILANECQCCEYTDHLFNFFIISREGDHVISGMFAGLLYPIVFGSASRATQPKSDLCDSRKYYSFLIRLLSFIARFSQTSNCNRAVCCVTYHMENQAKIIFPTS